jgi:hypothetical protein
MANKKRGEMIVDLGGRERKLKITLNDLAELQDMCGGKPLMEVLSELDKLNIKILLNLLYLALRHDDKDLSIEQVGSWEMNITDIATKLGEALALSLGGPKPGKK